MKPNKTYSGRCEINMYRGDCMDLMKSKPDNYYQLSIVDPPYGLKKNLNTKIGYQSFVKGYHESYMEKGWDEKPNKKYFNNLFNVSENQIICGGNYFKLPISRGWVFYDKKIGHKAMAQGELFWTSFDRTIRVFRMHTTKNLEIGGGRIHPTQKPVQLYKWLLTNYAKEGDRILDTHGGSMSIAIACWDLGFDLDIIELDKDYFNDSVQRFETHISQTQLF